MTDTSPAFQRLEFTERYYIQTAKNAIESLTHIAEEIGSNEDEAITRRAERDGGPDEGTIVFAYDPGTTMLEVTGDGLGMTAADMVERLGRVGESPEATSKRSFFHRGVREVFLAMGGGEVISIGERENGERVLSRAVFDPYQGMAIEEHDRPVTPEDRDDLGLSETGTRVRVPLKRFASKKPRLYEFSAFEAQIRDCVGLRVVLTDPGRVVRLRFDETPARELRFEYPEGEDLVALRTVEVSGHTATFWAKIAEKPIKGVSRRRTRRNGILVRGERAAYEVALGEVLRNHPAMTRVFGELRIDDIEAMQRQADKQADDESQLIYKTDRSGLNPEHPFVEAVYRFIDETLAPLIADLDANDSKKQVTPDMRRQLQKLAREINQVLKEAHVDHIDDPGGKPTDETEQPEGPEPPDPPPPSPRDVDDGIEFAYDRIFIDAGGSRTVKVWIDVAKVSAGTGIRIISPPDEMISAATLSRADVPAPGGDGVAEVNLTLKAGAVEGRHEVVVVAGGYKAVLPVHVRYPRASGFISQIIPEDLDWEAGSALWDPASGVVRVFVGRPEFRDAVAAAKRGGATDEWKDPLYRQLVVESVREAALWPAAVRRAEIDWDELPQDERQDTNGFHQLVQSEFQALDYLLRRKLLKAFVES